MPQQNVLTPPDLTLFIGDVDLAPYVTSFRCSLPWNGKATLRATITEFNSTTHLVSPYPTNVINGVLNHYQYPPLVVPPVPPHINPTPTTPNKANILSATLTTAGVPSEWPLFLNTSPQTDGIVSQIAGEDFTGLLELVDQSMPTITTTLNPSTAQTAFTFICATYGINRVVYNWPDYKIHELKRTAGVPLNWIDQISRPYVANRTFRGDTLYSSSLGGNCTVTPTPTTEIGLLAPPLQQRWTFADYQVIETLNLEFAEPPKNEFTVGRTQANNIIGQADCTGGQCVGRTLNVSFNSPVTAVVPHVNKCLQGSMVDFVYFKSDGTPVNATAPSVGPVVSPTPIVRVEATYIPAFTQAGQSTTVGAPGGYLVGGLGNYGYDVTFTGGTDTNSSDTLFAVRVDSTPAQTMYGLNKEYTPITDPIIPNGIVLSDMANCICYDSVRKTFWCKIRTPKVISAVNAGDLAYLTDNSTNQDNRPWFIEQVDFVMEDRDDWKMELILTRGPSLTS